MKRVNVRNILSTGLCDCTSDSSMCSLCRYDQAMSVPSLTTLSMSRHEKLGHEKGMRFDD